MGLPCFSSPDNLARRARAYEKRQRVRVAVDDVGEVDVDAAEESGVDAILRGAMVDDGVGEGAMAIDVDDHGEDDHRDDGDDEGQPQQAPAAQAAPRVCQPATFDLTTSNPLLACIPPTAWPPTKEKATELQRALQELLVFAWKGHGEVGYLPSDNYLPATTCRSSEIAPVLGVAYEKSPPLSAAAKEKKKKALKKKRRMADMAMAKVFWEGV